MSNLRIIPRTETPGELRYVQCTGCHTIYHPGFRPEICACEEYEAAFVPWDPALDTSPHNLPDMLIGLLDEIEQAGLHLDKEDGTLWTPYLDALCYLARTSTAGRYFWREE